MNYLSEAKNGIDYEVRLSPNEAWQRIAASSILEQPYNLTIPGFEGDKPVLCRVEGSEIKIRKRVYYKNRNQIFLSLRIEPTNYGSRLKGHFEMSKTPRLILAILMLIFPLFAFFLMNSDSVSQIIAGENIPVNSLNFFPLLLYIVTVISLILGFILPKSEEQGIRQWLDDLFADVLIRHK